MSYIYFWILSQKNILWITATFPAEAPACRKSQSRSLSDLASTTDFAVGAGSGSSAGTHTCRSQDMWRRLDLHQPMTLQPNHFRRPSWELWRPQLLPSNMSIAITTIHRASKRPWSGIDRYWGRSRFRYYHKNIGLRRASEGHAKTTLMMENLHNK